MTSTRNTGRRKRCIDKSYGSRCEQQARFLLSAHGDKPFAVCEDHVVQVLDDQLGNEWSIDLEKIR